MIYSRNVQAIDCEVGIIVDVVLYSTLLEGFSIGSFQTLDRSCGTFRESQRSCHVSHDVDACKSAVCASEIVEKQVIESSVALEVGRSGSVHIIKSAGRIPERLEILLVS